MFWGYNTNGLGCHDFSSGLELLLRNDYQGVALTIDYGWLNPKNVFSDTFVQQICYLQELQKSRRIRYVLETGARFLLNPYQKHEPTLISPDSEQRQQRVLFYKFAIDCAQVLHADCVSIWSGVSLEGIRTASSCDVSESSLMKRLTSGLVETLDYAANKNVCIAFEPEPGMFIADMAAFERLLDALDGDERLKLTVDIGHLCCNSEPIPQTILRWKDRMVNIHIEDMRTGVHEHLPFGSGTINFRSVFDVLRQTEYSNGVYVELSRDSYRAPDAVRESRAFLARFEE